MITVNFRALNGKSYSFNVDPSSAISDIDFSSKIPDYYPTTKFIYKGKKLPNSTKLSSLSLSPNDFIVVYNPAQYRKHAKLPEDLNVSIEDEFEEQGQTRIYKPPDHPSVQPLPDISRPTESGVQLVRGLIEPPEIAGMSESLYSSAALPHLYQAISKNDFDDDDGLDSTDEDYDDNGNENGNDIDDNVNSNGNEMYDRSNSPPPQNQRLYGIEGSESLTTEDRQAISRLRSLTNIEESIVIQVFLLCNKEEETTASCLLSSLD